MFVTWFQCVVTVALCFLLSIGARLFPGVISFPEFKIEPKVAREVRTFMISFVVFCQPLFRIIKVEVDRSRWIYRLTDHLEVEGLAVLEYYWGRGGVAIGFLTSN